MSAAISAVTLGEDLDRAKQFHGEGLGCSIDQDHAAFVSFQLGNGSALALYGWNSLAEDAGVAPEGTDFVASR